MQRQVRQKVEELEHQNHDLQQQINEQSAQNNMLSQ